MFDFGKNSEKLTLQGKTTWARLFSPNKYDKWSLNFYPNKDSLDKFRDLQMDGVKNQLKKDDDGIYFQISRPTTIELRKGLKTPVTPPRVLNNGTPVEDLTIGNGSGCDVTLEVYTHPVPNTDKRAKAIRLYSVDITDLVPFVSADNATEGWNGKSS